jgi:hypothetical protein
MLVPLTPFTGVNDPAELSLYTSYLGFIGEMFQEDFLKILWGYPL